MFSVLVGSLEVGMLEATQKLENSALSCVRWQFNQLPLEVLQHSVLE